MAGLIVVAAGYSAAFWTLAAIALAAFALLLLAMPETGRNTAEPGRAQAIMTKEAASSG